MAYTPTEWTNGDALAATKFNKMENGLKSADSSYVPTEWTPGDVITAEALNKIENGIAAAGSGGGGGGGNSGVEADYRGLSYAFLDSFGGFRTSTTKIYYMNAFRCTGGTKYIILPPPEISHNRFRIAYYYNKSYSDFESYIEAAGAAEIVVYNCDEFSTRDTTPYLNQPYVITPAQDGELIVVTDNQSTTAPAYLLEALNTN